MLVEIFKDMFMHQPNWNRKQKTVWYFILLFMTFVVIFWIMIIRIAFISLSVNHYYIKSTTCFYQNDFDCGYYWRKKAENEKAKITYEFIDQWQK